MNRALTCPGSLSRVLEELGARPVDLTAWHKGHVRIELWVYDGEPMFRVDSPNRSRTIWLFPGWQDMLRRVIEVLDDPSR